MPKAYTDNERKYIKKRLIEEAQDCLKRYGFKKTTVDELVKRVNIPKGTFYLFYESKEQLFYEVQCLFHDKLHSYLMSRLEAMDKPASAEQMTGLLLELYKKIEASFFYQFVTNGDFELLMRKLPPEVACEHAKKDDLSIEQLISMVSGIKSDSIKAFSAALRAIFLSMLHRNEIGEDVFEDALRLMIRGVVMQMYEEVFE